MSNTTTTVPMENKSNTKLPSVSAKKEYKTYDSYKSYRWNDTDNKDISFFKGVPAPSVKLDKDLYKSLLTYRAHSGSKTQQRYKKYIQTLLNAIPNVRTHEDKAGNLYAIKGDATLTVPCIVSHLDINQRKITGEALPIFAGDWIIGINNMSGLQCGLGHDDKAGNLFAIQAFHSFDNIRAIFTIDEEIGGKGAYMANTDFFDTCSFLIQLDRNAYECAELISYSGGINMCSAGFITAISGLMFHYGFVESDGVFTDVNCLKSIGALPSAFNLTAGYYDEHTSEETLYIPAWENSASFAYELIKTFGHISFPHVGTSRYDYSKKDKYDTFATSYHEDDNFGYVEGLKCVQCDMPNIIKSQNDLYCDVCCTWQ